MLRASTVLEKFHPKPSEAEFLSFFLVPFRPEVDNDVIFGVAVDYVRIDVHLKFVILGQTVIELFKELILC